jgi:hypothetical protein
MPSRAVLYEQRNGLDVKGLGKEVQWLHNLQVVAAIDELAGVARQRGGIAGYVSEPLGLQPQNLA